MNNWKKYKLGDITFWKSGGTPVKMKKEYWNGNIPWISAKNMTSSRISSSSISISKEGLDNGSRLAKENSLLLLVRGSGLYNDIPIAIVTKPVAFNQDVKSIEVNEEIIKPWFLLYWLIGNKTVLNTKLEATGIGAGKFDIDMIKELEIFVPSLEEQDYIIKIALCWDDKIELNRRMNQTLEQMAQALFNHYFVDNIDPDNLPEGWKISSLDKIADYLNGVALQKYRPKNDLEFLPVIKIKELKNGLSSSTEKADVNIPEIYIINDGDVLFSWSGSLEVDLWCNGKGALNQHLFKVSSGKYPKWFYYMWTKEHLQSFKNTAASKATTMGHIQRHHLTEAEVFLPPKNYLEEKGKSIEPLIDLIISNRLENNKLSKIRDTLLPKLMSGEIDVDALMMEETLSQKEPIENFKIE